MVIVGCEMMSGEVDDLEGPDGSLHDYPQHACPSTPAVQLPARQNRVPSELARSTNLMRPNNRIEPALIVMMVMLGW